MGYKDRAKPKSWLELDVFEGDRNGLKGHTVKKIKRMYSRRERRTNKVPGQCVEIIIDFTYKDRKVKDKDKLINKFDSLGLELKLKNGEGSVSSESDCYEEAHSIEKLCKKLIPGFELTCMETIWY